MRQPDADTTAFPIKHEGTPEVNQMLMDHFGLKNMEQLLRVVGDDFRYVEPVYCGPELRTFPDGSIEGYFGERYKYAQFESGKYLEACYLPFAGVDSLEDLDRSHFPTADWFDYSTIRQQAERLREQGFAVCCGTAGDIDLINGISRARGMEQVLMDLVDDNPVYLEIMQARFDFFYEMHRRMLEAAGGLVDFTHIGEDLGNQRGPMISMAVFERHFAPKYGKYFQMVHCYGARTMMHMCGCVREVPAAVDRVGAGRLRRGAAHHAGDGHRRACGAVRRPADASAARCACRRRSPGARRRTSRGKCGGGWSCFPTAACSSVPPMPSRSARRWRTSWPCTARPAACAKKIDAVDPEHRGGRQPGEINLSKLF